MRTTVILNDHLLNDAKAYSKTKRTSDVLNEALEEYVRKHAAERLAALGGSLADSTILAPQRRSF
jgi:hypothetical protein